MAILSIGYTSSHCETCQKAGRYSSATPSEAGHYTCLGYSKELNGTAGCQEKWDSVVMCYPVDIPKEDAVRLFKERWPHLAGVPDENWVVFSWARESNT